MSEFANVTVVREANVYYDGRVTSRTVRFSDGTKKTLGIMLAGEYEFGTEKKEIMEVLSGEADIRLPGSHDWKRVTAGDTFEVPADSKFGLKIGKVLDYCCSYLD